MSINVVGIDEALRNQVDEILSALKRTFHNPLLYRKTDNGSFTERPIEVFVRVPGYIEALKTNKYITDKFSKKLLVFYHELFEALSNLTKSHLTSSEIETARRLISTAIEIKHDILSNHL